MNRSTVAYVLAKAFFMPLPDLYSCYLMVILSILSSLYSSIKLAEKEGVIILCLPPHTTHES